MGEHTIVGHPFVEEKNHASSGMHKSMKLGGGGRFENLTHELAAKGASNPKALAAVIGRKKYGAHKMAQMAAAHR